MHSLMIALLSICASCVFAAEKKMPKMTPGGKYAQGDMKRPRPPVITPPGFSNDASPGNPPSDAIVLFNGRDLSHWTSSPRKDSPDPADTSPKWKIQGGFMEIVPKSGALVSKEKFADCQIHLEWAAPGMVQGSGQGRGNSGVFLQGHPEIQVLDSYGNDTYPDGQAAALYHQYPPLVNASRPPAFWQTYDVIYIAPKFENKKRVADGYLTVIHNGVVVHHHVPLTGNTTETSLLLQDHLNPVRYRNIWVRKLGELP